VDRTSATVQDRRRIGSCMLCCAALCCGAEQVGLACTRRRGREGLRGQPIGATVRSEVSAGKEEPNGGVSRERLWAQWSSNSGSDDRATCNCRPACSLLCCTCTAACWHAHHASCCTKRQPASCLPHPCPPAELAVPPHHASCMFSSAVLAHSELGSSRRAARAKAGSETEPLPPGPVAPGR